MSDIGLAGHPLLLLLRCGAVEAHIVAPGRIAALFRILITTEAAILLLLSQ